MNAVGRGGRWGRTGQRNDCWTREGPGLAGTASRERVGLVVLPRWDLDL